MYNISFLFKTKESDQGSAVLTSLGAGHQVPLGLDNGDGMFLNRGGTSVATQGDVSHDDLPHVHVMELQNNGSPSVSIRSASAD